MISSAISIFSGWLKHRTSPQRYIEDPFDLRHNLASACSAAGPATPVYRKGGRLGRAETQSPRRSKTDLESVAAPDGSSGAPPRGVVNHTSTVFFPNEQIRELVRNDEVILCDILCDIKVMSAHLGNTFISGQWFNMHHEMPPSIS